MSVTAMLARTTNKALGRFDLALVRASRLGYQYDLAAATEDTFQRPTIVAAASPTHGDPRLTELRAAYCALHNHPARAMSLWTEDFAARIDLTRFREHNAYLWQQSRTPAQRLCWLLVGYYVHSADTLCLLDRLTEDGLFGAETFRFMNRYIGSKDLLDSINEINFLDRALGISTSRSLRVLDIGAGYGRLCHRLTEAFPGRVSGFMVDAIAESTFLSEWYSRFRGFADQVRTVPLHEVDTVLKGASVDLVTNIHSFSECRFDAIRWWLDKVDDIGARNLFVVPNAYHNGGRELLSREPDGRYLDFRVEIDRRGFNLKACEPKYRDESFSQFGINTYYYLFARS
jgi:SAM-dependent methyltransferase